MQGAQTKNEAYEKNVDLPTPASPRSKIGIRGTVVIILQETVEMCSSPKKAADVKEVMSPRDAYGPCAYRNLI